jgi:ribose transport system permease protein
MKLQDGFKTINKLPGFRTIQRLSGLIFLMVVFSFLTANFFKLNNLLTVTLQMAIYALLAMGMGYVLIIGGADLSAGAVAGLSGMLFTIFLSLGINAPLAVIFTLLISIAIGICNGFMVTKMHMIPFIATLGTQYIARGFTQILSNGSSISLRTASRSDALVTRLNFIGSGRIFNLIPIATIIVFVLLMFHHIILTKTVLGRKIYAVGSNTEASRLSGIKSDRITIIAYAICTFMAGFAGLMLVMRLSTAQATAGTGYEFEGIAASVIGGVSLLGGEGSMVGTLIGASILAVMRNGMNLLGLNAFWQNVITGFVIIIAVYLDISRRRHEASTV